MPPPFLRLSHSAKLSFVGLKRLLYSINNELEQAIADYDRAIEIDPEYAIAYDSRGIAYRKRGELERLAGVYSATFAAGRSFGKPSWSRLAQSFPLVTNQD